MEQTHWRKASYSDAHGNCVEVAPAPGGVMVRDSKVPAARLAFTSQAWADLMADLKARHGDA
ncbi:DUF397 domain-containing protein [Actinomadura sp. LOL_016]|uniref:DUF397 domain-containing protein n=1 Tax=unclassified Actinomadura TaxID=2626254 RepID=UPI003A7FA6FA